MSHLLRVVALMTDSVILSVDATLDLPHPSEPPTAKADGIVTYNLRMVDNRDPYSFEFWDLYDFPPFRWSYGPYRSSDGENIQPIIMVFKASADEHTGWLPEAVAVRQMSMCIATALHHCIALGIDEEGDNIPVYGLLQVATELRLYTGHARPPLPSDVHFKKRIVCCYLFLSS